jgi:hypothetical protein
MARLSVLLAILLSACMGRATGPEPPPPGSPAPPAAPPPAGETPPLLRLPPPVPAEPTRVFVPPGLQPSFVGLPRATTPPPALAGGTLRVVRGGQLAVAADPDRDRLFVVDLAREAVRAEIALQPGDEPGRVVEDGAGRVHVALRRGGAVVTLAPAADALADRRDVCPAPRGLAAGGDTLYVACAGGELVALPAAGGAPLWTRQLPRDLRDVVVDGARLLVSTFRGARVLVLDGEGNLVDELAPPVSLNLTRRERAGAGGAASTRFTPSVAWRTLALPGGGALMLHQRGFTGEVTGDSNSGGGSGGYGSTGCGGGIVQTVVSALVPGLPQKASPELAGAALAIDMALSADGRRVALVSPADARVVKHGSLLSVATLETVTAVSDTGCVDVSGLGSGFGAPLPVPDPRADTGAIRLRGDAVAVAFDGLDELVVQLREPAVLYLPARAVEIALSGASRADLGHAIFHANTGAGIACASCHPEGAEDGRVWRFAGLGPRRTQSLRGGVAETLPLHWDGDMRDVAHIAREVFTGRMGGPALSDDGAAGLAAFLESIPLLRHGPPGDTAAVERGRALFNDARVGCGACHGGPRLSNNQSADVGTGRALQVPSLVGLGDRAPFMHTGCADTLAARFSTACGGGERHGATAGLDTRQQEDLRLYLESL